MLYQSWLIKFPKPLPWAGPLTHFIHEKTGTRKWSGLPWFTDSLPYKSVVMVLELLKGIAHDERDHQPSVNWTNISLLHFIHFIVNWTIIAYNIVLVSAIRQCESATVIHGVQSQHSRVNRWGNKGNTDRLYFFWLQNHCRWWLQPWN